ncbi:MAG: SGNH/GDSL hydrolase family protein [Candidatus Neomarinimicrobiota bacterium]
MKTILCFGDSNTWGFVPGAFDSETFYMERYPISKRWPGVMGNLLGNEFHIIEEGLNGRTTNIEYPDIVGRSATSYIEPCLYSHAPLDIVVVQLGINDLKNIFYRNISSIASGMAELIDLISMTSFGTDMQSPPKILLLAPPPLVHEKYIDQNNHYVFKGGMEKSFEFGRYYSKIAEKKNCHYMDLSSIVKYSAIDGLHLDEKGHEIVGTALANKIENIFQK